MMSHPVIDTSVIGSGFSLPKSQVLDFLFGSDWGLYFVDYQGVGGPKLLEKLRFFDTQFLQSYDGDFLYLGTDKDKNELSIISSISGKFPVYFSCFKDRIVVSTDIGEVVRRTKIKSLNVRSAVDYLFTDYFLYITHETPFESIFKLPPGCRLRIDAKFRFKIEPMMKANDFLSKPVKKYINKLDFQRDLLSKIGHIVAKYGKYWQSKGKKITSDLSCGFDSTLIAYNLKNSGFTEADFFSYQSKFDTGDTVSTIVKEFATKHNLKLNVWDESGVVTFDDIDIEWTQKHFFPGTHAALKEILTQKYKNQLLGSDFVTYHGYGGDELYMANLIGHDLDKIIAEELSWVKQGIQLGIDKIFTQQALGVLSDKKRFLETPIYFSPLATTALEWFVFPVYWEFNDWGVLPYNDLELNQLARGIPVDNDNKALKKQAIWAGKTDIFTQSQFRQKLPFDNHVSRIFDLRKDFLIKTLKNSVLGKLGIVNSEDMAQVISQGKGKEHFSGILPVFINVIRLEIFLQGN